MERYVVSDFSAAAEHFDRAFRMDTTLLVAALWYANSSIKLGGALSHAHARLSAGDLALAAALRGDTAAAGGYLTELESSVDAFARWRLPYARSRVAAALGDADDAVRLLREAVAAGLRYVNNPLTDSRFLKHDPALHPLRDHAGFVELMTPPSAREPGTRGARR